MPFCFNFINSIYELDNFLCIFNQRKINRWNKGRGYIFEFSSITISTILIFYYFIMWSLTTLNSYLSLYFIAPFNPP